MSKENNKIDHERFNILLDDFAKELDIPISDLAETNDSNNDFSRRKDYRYIKNDTLPFFFIELYTDSTKVLVDKEGKPSIYEYHDEETFKALRPLIIKAINDRFEFLKKQIVYQEKYTRVIVRESFLDKKETLLYLYFKGEEYTASAKYGKISLTPYSMTPDALSVYMNVVEKFLFPYARKKQCQK